MRPKISWTTEFSRAFKNAKELFHFLEWEMPSALEEVTQTYPVFIPQKLAQKIKTLGPESALAKEFLPRGDELGASGFADPIGDQEYNVAPQLIHRYKNRVLFTATSICPVLCRYCFRKNELNAKDSLFAQEFQETLAYLEAHPEINEIIFTGGDPFTLSNEKLGTYLEAFSKIKSIQHVRFHTRYPVILPERFDEGLLALLNQYAQVFETLSLAIHANHLTEFDEEANEAILALGKLPLQLLSQTVLLKGVNDSVEDLLQLIKQFISLKVRPYYLHHPDQVKGGMHFYLPLETGRNLYGLLRNELPGWGLPQYVIDLPGGHGKTQAYNPETTTYSGTLLSRSLDRVRISEPEILS